MKQLSKLLNFNILFKLIFLLSHCGGAQRLRLVEAGCLFCPPLSPVCHCVSPLFVELYSSTTFSRSFIPSSSPSLYSKLLPLLSTLLFISSVLHSTLSLLSTFILLKNSPFARLPLVPCYSVLSLASSCHSPFPPPHVPTTPSPLPPYTTKPPFSLLSSSESHSHLVC